MTNKGIQHVIYDEYNILTNYRVCMLLGVHAVCVLSLIRNNARRSRGEKA